MNKFDELDTLRHAQPLFEPDGGLPAELRARTVAGFREQRRRKGFQIPRWSIAVPTALAALALVGVVAVRGGDSGTPSAEPPASGTSAAADLLMRAANAVPVARNPRADQFLYVETVGLMRTVRAGQASRTEPTLRQVWLSIDGTRDGLIRQGPAPGFPAEHQRQREEIVLPGCRDGRIAAVGPDAKVVPGRFEKCDKPSPVFDAKLPTDAASMMRYIRKTSGLDPSIQFQHLSDLLGEFYLTAEQRTALFGAAAQIPGVVAVDNAVDILGRSGVAVSITSRYAQPTVQAYGPKPSGPAVLTNVPTGSGEMRQQLIFDAKTYAYLGYRTIADNDPADARYGSSVLTTAIVNRAG
jgi:hypothetical protein